MIHSILYVEMDIFAALVLLVIMKRGRISTMSLDQKMFKLSMLVLIGTLVMDAGTWYFDGASSPAGIFMLYLTEYLYWGLSLFVCYLLLLYCMVFTQGRLERKLCLIFAVPLLPGLVLLALNPVLGLAFTFTPEHVYVRGSYFILIGGVSVVHLTLAFIVAIRKAMASHGRERIPYIRLTWLLVVTFLGLILQVLLYGVLTIWPGVTLAILMCYVFLQNSNLAMDPLTGLNNRRRYDEYASQACQNADPYAQFCLMMMDIDCFKNINDTYGHEEGDQALIRTARVLQKCMSDESGFLARIGGDEFSIILPDTNDDEILNLIYLIRHSLTAENAVSGKPYCITLSIGYACRSGKELDFTKLFAEADRRMYEYKQAGRCDIRLNIS